MLWLSWNIIFNAFLFGKINIANLSKDISSDENRINKNYFKINKPNLEPMHLKLGRIRLKNSF